LKNDLSVAVRDFELQERGAKIFLKKVENPQSYGVASFGSDEKIEEILEKPQNPPSDLAVVGCYMYDPQVFDVVRNLKPSHRKELEITDVNNFYLKQGTLGYDVLEGFWGDCGESFDSLFVASSLVKNSHLSQIDENLTLP
jgi:glucose-1-phosphate thymidylyltransferase